MRLFSEKMKISDVNKCGVVYSITIMLKRKLLKTFRLTNMKTRWNFTFFHSNIKNSYFNNHIDLYAILNIIKNSK